MVQKFRNVARKAFASFKAGQESRPSEAEQKQLSMLSGASHIIYSNTNKSQGSSPDPSDQSSTTALFDMHSTLQKHFRTVEWEQQKYDPLKTAVDVFNPAVQPADIVSHDPAIVDYFHGLSHNGGIDFSNFDFGAMDALPGLAPGQLPMPLDGVNYNYGVSQEQHVEDPLDFLSKQRSIGPSAQSWDYQP